MSKAISYIRFSTGKQAKGSSHERQQAMLASWLTANPDFTLSSESFKDLGISGFSGKHLKSGFGLLLEAVENGSIQVGDVILIEAMDRVGRLEPMEMLPLLSRIVSRGVDIVTLDDGIRYDRESANSNHLFLLVAKVQQAYQYSDTLSRRMKASYSSRKRAAAEGVTPKRNTPVWLTSEGALIPEIAPLVKQAFEDYASGLGERRIFERIFEGNDNPLLARMAPSTVKRWMNNRTAIGEWNGIPNVYPAVIEPELFYRVQKRMEEKFAPRGAPTKHRFTGLVVCAECGKNFNTKHYANTGITSMECSSRARRGSVGCSNNRSIPEPIIELAFQFTNGRHIMKALEGQQLTASQKRGMELDGEIGEVNKKIKRIIGFMENLDEGDGEELTNQYKSLQAERRVLQAEKEGLVSDDSISIMDKVTNIKEFTNDPMRANALLQSVGYQLVCHVDGRVMFENEAFMYEGWGRSEDVHKVLLPDGKRIKLPIHRLGKTPKSEPVDVSQLYPLDLTKR
ncbi:recombinase family protein [Pseudomonas chlororaphis]|uniref:recombinase family protein n=1 Tax=Pseudomonas chlororaphis TaxID=587753 RepID=UPI0030D12361